MTLFVQTQGAGIDMVLLHGWAMHSGVWEGWLQHLSTFARVHCVDLPGHGFSLPFSSALSLPAIVEAVQACVPDQAVWVGWSFGALVALYAARYSRCRIRSLGLIAASPCFSQRPQWRCAVSTRRLQIWIEQIQQEPQAVLNQFLTLQTQGASDPAGEKAALERTLHTRPAPDLGTLSQGLQLLKDTDLRLTLPQLSQPTQLLYGKKDALVPIATARRMGMVLQKCRLTVVPNAGHLPFLTAPKPCAETLKDLCFNPPTLPLKERAE